MEKVDGFIRSDNYRAVQILQPINIKLTRNYSNVKMLLFSFERSVISQNCSLITRYNK
jgi:hypothetical protein